ncbi:winged helix-turn-helix domain-containing protein [Alteromonas gilva]|uniref:Winged helix-turn-helix domain-containing protein n=1 Tax=Alteromonas gilva TaxID=2987522 RepID=A0ABT5KXN8_9ALTE|nr:winged helix-turn-helix domain-containing protein [Alteromonas gilva]MDC8829544.1 winged helix-turn-helix domain-containing protein [Alteromonas gilva]
MWFAASPITLDELRRRVWRSQNCPLTNVVDVYINRLRKKLHCRHNYY